MRRKRSNASTGNNLQASLADVCRLVGASSATVSRALNNKPGVGPDLRQRVLEAVRRLNYVPKAAARNLSRAKSDTLGIVFQDLTPGWLLTVFRGIMSRAIGSYYILTALSTHEGDETELPRKLLAEKRIDGLIWMDSRATPKMVREMGTVGVPFVVLQRQVAMPGVNSVTIECRHSAYDATRHLLNLGYRRIALMTGPAANEDSQEKMAGAQQAMSEHGVHLAAENVLVGHHVGIHAVNAMSAFLEAGHKLPEAIFAFNDDMAVSLLSWLRGRGIRVPQDVALIGFDGIAETEIHGLTTVVTPMQEMGVLATQTLIDLIERPSNNPEARHVVLKGHLQIRETCGTNIRKLKTS